MPPELAESWRGFLHLDERSSDIAVVTTAGMFTRGDLFEAVNNALEALEGVTAGQVLQLRFVRNDVRALVATIAAWELRAIPLFQDASASTDRARETARSVGAVASLDAADADGTSPPQRTGTLLSVRWLDPENELDVNGADAGYLVQTSGSSGVPRSSLNTSSGLRNTVAGLIERYHLDERSRALQFAPHGYDAWLADALPTIRAGGCVVYGPVGEWSGFRVLERTMNELGVTHAVMPPSVWRSVNLSSLRVAISAGEALDPPTAMKLAHTAWRVINAYGPSEAAVCSSTHEVNPDQLRIPLGEPLPGVRLSAIEDETGRSCLRIYGAGVALGYVCEGAIASGQGTPGSGWFGTDENGPFFQTADVVEIHDGAVYFVGRTDRIVKRSGRRVHLERVEAAVRSLDGVTDCVVAVEGDQIVCEVVADATAAVDTAALATSLEPWEMPVIRLEQDLARTRSDKIVSRVSASPSSGSSDIEAVRAIWTATVTSDDENSSFFALGGDSFGAMELLDEVAARTGAEIDIADFVTEPTLTALLELVSQCRNAD